MGKIVLIVEGNVVCCPKHLHFGVKSIKFRSILLRIYTCSTVHLIRFFIYQYRWNFQRDFNLLLLSEVIRKCKFLSGSAAIDELIVTTLVYYAFSYLSIIKYTIEYL